MYKIYTVLENETLSSIAQNFKTSVAELRKINDFPINYEVKTGEQIIVPSSRTSPFQKYVVKKGDTLYSISKSFNLSVDDLASLNGMDKDDFLYPNQELLVPMENVKVHITKEGDTLGSVLTKLSTTPEKLMAENEVIYLFPNQLLIKE